MLANIFGSVANPRHFFDLFPKRPIHRPALTSHETGMRVNLLLYRISNAFAVLQVQF